MWRLINSGPGTGSWNMAVDEAILEACIRGEVAPTLRIYSWQPPAISLGHFQRPERALNLDACRAKGLEVARRPTGGRAILHDKEITFSIIAPLSSLGTQGVMESYRYLAQGIIAGLHKVGVPAELMERSAQSPQAAVKPTQKGSPAACFAVKARCDLMVAGRKIVGSAQVHRGQTLLQQNSLPFLIESDKWREFFQGMDGNSEGSAAMGLWEAAGRSVGPEEAAEALRQGFEEALGVAFTSSELTEAEKERAVELLPLCRVAAPGSKKGHSTCH
ncbi:MAG: hypothetical protein GTO55_10320 [Armatimonadetes bacterium]|nr:hypothetical protein [Armatimonadota bacterium]NIM24632.1 hypothetical protein [Armatimonadota bacterium]NIM68511.1 hypothetical protein [Armatimonadota bacterium]NIM76893.1 hypothetical protein [Armatimonadota bacterium]NIN06705.1 hypothetical protein [Armatimonadota bacterium]